MPETVCTCGNTFGMCLLHGRYKKGIRGHRPPFRHPGNPPCHEMIHWRLLLTLLCIVRFQENKDESTTGSTLRPKATIVELCHLGIQSGPECSLANETSVSSRWESSNYLAYSIQCISVFTTAICESNFRVYAESLSTSHRHTHASLTTWNYNDPASFFFSFVYVWYLFCIEKSS